MSTPPVGPDAADRRVALTGAGPSSGTTSPSPMAPTGSAVVDERGRGIAYGLAAYVIWGSFPLYIQALAPAGAWEILAERVLWSLACCLVLLGATGGLRGLWARLGRGRTLAGVGLAGVLISVNWVTYLIAVTTGRIAEAALGYFLTPLVSVALGMVFLRERLRRLQALAVTIGAVAAVILAIDARAIPVIPLTLAVPFGLYGLVKHRLAGGLTAAESLTAETALVAPLAGLLLVVLAVRGETTFGGYGVPHAVLLASTGLMTAVPLLLFAATARRVTLITVGLLQFVAPILQFGCALLLGEQLSPGRWLGFGVVWCALAVLVLDILRQGRRRGRQVNAVPA